YLLPGVIGIGHVHGRAADKGVRDPEGAGGQGKYFVWIVVERIRGAGVGGVCRGCSAGMVGYACMAAKFCVSYRCTVVGVPAGGGGGAVDSLVDGELASD